MAKKRIRGNPVPLITEPHPDGYSGYPFITLLQYRKQHVLAIVDNADEKFVRCFVLDLCGPEQINEEEIIQIASNWYKNKSSRYPISFEFSKLGMSSRVEKIYRTYNTEFVTRVIGPLPKFEMVETKRIKRRKRKPVPHGVEVKKVTKLY